MQRAIFLDRDGTLVRLIYRGEYLGVSWKSFTAPFYVNEINFEYGLREALAIFKGFGYLIGMITNQPDVAHGLITKTAWQKIHRTILKEVRPDFWLACPHTSREGCMCKKPKPGMLQMAAEGKNICLWRSFMIGDTEKDMLAGKRAGCKTILIRRPYNLENKEANDNADHVVKNLLEATAIV